MTPIEARNNSMFHIDLGSGPPLLCMHGSLGDFRSWSPVLGPLSRRHRLIVPSLIPSLTKPDSCCRRAIPIG